MYSPNKNIVGHDYGESLAKHANDKFSPSTDGLEWEENGMTPLYRRFLYDRTVERMKLVLGSHAHVNTTYVELLTQYGLGPVRSLQQFAHFVGMNLIDGSTVIDRCTELAWVSYDTKIVHIHPDVSHGDVWGLDMEHCPQGHHNIPLLNQGHEVDAFDLSMYHTLVVPTTVVEEIKSEEKEVLSEEDAKPVTSGEDVDADPEHQHRGKELWYIFQTIDTTLEAIIQRVDLEIGTRGHGHLAMKYALMSFPIMLGVIYLAILIITNGTIPGTGGNSTGGSGKKVPPSKAGNTWSTWTGADNVSDLKKI